MTSLRSFLMFYLPLLEPRTDIEEDDDDFLQDNQEERHVDLVVPFKKSVKQIFREVHCIDIPCFSFIMAYGSALVHSMELICMHVIDSSWTIIYIGTMIGNIKRVGQLL